MVDEFVEVVTKSFGQRIISSLWGILFGILLFIASFFLIFWNEGHSVDRIKTLDEGLNLVIPLSADQIDPAHEGDLVHLSGHITTDNILKDPLFGIQEKALQLRRIAEMYQWQEDKKTTTEQNLGGSETNKTTYSYKKIWTPENIDSNNFKNPDGHRNPEMPYRTSLYSANHIYMGGFQPAQAFIHKMDSFEPYPLQQHHYDAMSNDLKSSFKLIGDEYFKGNPDNPEIGAIRIRYEILAPTDISIVGKQSKNVIQPYRTKSGEISLLGTGHVSAEALFASAQSENTLITWLIRGGTFLLMWVGLAMVLSPISVLGSVVPFIGNMLGAGIGIVTGLIAIVLSLVTIAIAWLVFRPIIGIALLVTAGVCLVAGFQVISRLKNSNSDKC